MLLDNPYCRGLMKDKLKDVQGQNVLASTKPIAYMDDTLKSNNYNLYFIFKLI